jgi:hypothetical protein
MKRFMLLASIALMLPVTALAQQKAHYSTAQLCQILQPCLPPAQYAKGPFLAKPVVRQVSLRQLQSVCGGGYAAFLGHKARPESIQAAVDAGGDFGTLGCAQVTASDCIVHVPSDLQAVLPDLYRLVLAHELGHCRGWVHARY